ncbi:hypothetical protein [Pseudophaeobacter sp. TrK17]|uniref:hypothetical protein n=1 Tax=Pseudophaeobacter sp. TrK17 TaxID=2815167 RepID=UPI0035CEBA70
MRPEKKPLFRRVNTKTHRVEHGDGGKSRWERNTKETKRNASSRGSMHKKHRHGLDYTPLYRFLLSKVGQDWDDVYSEAVARLDTEDPIFRMVALQPEDGERYVRTGESTYFSGLFVDEDNRLALVDPELTVDQMKPWCPCCTHTLNGARFTQSFEGQDWDQPKNETPAQ